MMDRRTLVKGALGLGAALTMGEQSDANEEKSKRPRIAAVVTEYRENSHADVIVTKLLEGCKTLDLDYKPGVEVASLYLDQVPYNDIGRETAERHKVPIFSSIGAALTLGGDRLAVDGVLLIGEHGSYPYNELGQHLYPRRRFFDAAAGVMRRSGRAVPVFNDKHLAYDWADAKAMYDTARELKIPFMAGSSVPVAWRKPDLALPEGVEMTEAVAVGYGGTEAYGFHALEGLQCMIERRKGGESGVKSVQCLSGPAVWDAGEQGLWSWKLLQAALACSEKPRVAAAAPAEIRAGTRDPDLFVIDYADGLKGFIFMLYGLADEFLFAARVHGEARPAATLFWLQEGKPFGHFGRLCREIERMVLTGRPPYPVERTLLTTGILDRVMQSRFRKGAKLATPELGIRYSVEG